MTVYPVFLDGLIGPSYHFGGLSFGNTLSESHYKKVSYPRKAALEGLEKMYLVSEYGVKQFFFPPVLNDIDMLFQQFGYSCFNQKNVDSLFNINPYFVSSIFSSSSAWLANLAHITPASDSLLKKIQITPANLNYCFHRSCDVNGYSFLLKKLFHNCSNVTIHPPIYNSFGDEGSANSLRLSSKTGEGFYVYIYGKTVDKMNSIKYPARQSKEAFEILIKHHHLSRKYLLIQQSKEAIDAGVFHNDVICFGMNNVLIVHESAFENQSEVLSKIKKMFNYTFSTELCVIEISNKMMSLEDAVKSYFFNSQLIPLNDGSLHCLIATHSRKYKGLDDVVSYIQSRLPHFSYSFVDCDESIKNGGGPACLRIGFLVNEQQYNNMNTSFYLSQKRYDFLKSFIIKYYPYEMTFDQLKEYKFLKECYDIVNNLYETL